MIQKVKNVFYALGSRLRGLLAGVRIFLEGTYGNTGMGSIIVSVLVCSALLSGVVQLLWFPAFSSFFCFFPALILMVLAAEVSYLVVRLVFGSKRRTTVYELLLFLACFAYISSWTGSLSFVQRAITTLVPYLCFVVLARSLWACLHNRRFSLVPLTSALISLAGVSALLVFLLTPGSRHTAYDSYPELARSVPLPPQKQVDAAPGPYVVETISYGVDEGFDVFSKTYDLSDMAGQNKLAEWNRKLAVGHTLDEAPVQGRIWYPADGKKCPVLFIVHGNHTYRDASYLGYEYLGTYLASHGYVVVSVDENMCNLLGDENDARGALLLENIWFLRSKLMTIKPGLWTMMDFNNMALAGHSRGGEAVTSTWLFNKLRTYPDNGLITFNTSYTVKSIIAIAPTTDQYEPAGHAVELQNVNYLLIHGSNDQDVTKVMGNKQYQNISWPSADSEHQYLKSRLYVGRANHGQFNTIWGAYDQSYPIDMMMNVRNLLPAEEQQTILKIFIKTFLDVTLKGDETNRDLLTDYRSYLDCLPDTVYQQSYETSSRICIADFEEDSDLKTASIPGGTMNGTDLGTWFERKWWNGSSGEKENHLLSLGADAEKGGTYTIALLPADFSGRQLVFDLADSSEDAKKEPQLLTMGITVKDTAGNTARVELSDLVPVYPTVWVQLAKQEFLWNKKSCRHQLQTVTIPFTAFAEKNPDLDVQSIYRITFNFDAGSDTSVFVDNIGIE